MAGLEVHYGCTDGWMILRKTNCGQPIWIVSYLAEGEVASALVLGTAAWSLPSEPAAQFRER